MIARQRDTARFFALRGLNHGDRFDALVCKFSVLFGKFNLGDSTRWLHKARLWRFILLARSDEDAHEHEAKHTDGEGGETAAAPLAPRRACWDATPGLALALQASFAPVPRFAPLARGAAEYDARAGVCLALRSLWDDEATSARRSSALVAAAAEASAAAAAAGAAGGETEEAHEGSDCPLLFQHSAIAATLPPWLLGAMPADATGAGDTSAAALRCWTTALAAASLRTLSFGWLVDLGEGPEGGATQRTLADAADAWLAAQPHLAPHLPALAAAARAQAADWDAAQHARVAAMREEELKLEGRRVQLAVRSSGEVMTALLTKHETFAVFLSPGIGFLHRWQQVMILVTCVVALLAVDIWFYFSRALNCCKDVRAQLGCSADVYASCTLSGVEYAGGECGALWAAAAALGAPDGLSDDYNCTAFPSDDTVRDDFLVALVCLACTLPIEIFLEFCFETSNEVEIPDAWLTWTPLRSLLLGANTWSYATARPGYVKRCVAQYANELDKLFIEIFAADAVRAVVTAPMRAARACAAAARRGSGAGKAAPADEGAATPRTHTDAHANDDNDDAASVRSDGAASSATRSAISEVASEARATARTGRLMGTIGFLGVYTIWAVMCWLVFAYGMLIYRLQSDGSETSYTKAWGIAYGLDQATEWKAVAKAAAFALLVLLVLEYVHIIPASRWLEDHLDTLSVHATLFTGLRTTWWQRVTTHLRFHSRVTT
jgi:hypothetical protein